MGKVSSEVIGMGESRSAPVQGGHEAVGRHDDGSFGQLEAVLSDALEVLPRSVGLTDCARSEVHHLVPVASDIGVELGDAEVGPVAADHGEDVAESVGSVREVVLAALRGREDDGTRLVMVPSMSEMTTEKSDSQRKTLEVQVAYPE